MTPYYADDLVTLYNADCLDVLPSLTGIDLVLTSPPYNLSGDGWSTKGSAKEWARLSDGYATHGDDMPHTEYVDWQHRVVTACWNALTPTGAIFYNHKPIARRNEIRLPFDLIPPDLPLRQVVTWDRGTGFCRNLTHFVPTFEWVLIVAKPDFRLTTRNVNDVWHIWCEQGSEHPAPFPLSLAGQAVGATTARVVLDPFTGSGTTLRAAKDLGRRSIGIEVDERYCEIAAKRLAQEVLDFGESA